MDLRSVRTWIWIVVICTAAGLLNFGHFYLDDLARGHAGTTMRRFIEEMTGAYSALVLFPIVCWIAVRYRWSLQTWPVTLAVSTAGLVLYTLLHTSLMAASRAAIFPFAGMGAYDYGAMQFRYPMEAAGDAATYAIVLALLYLVNGVRAAKAAQLESAQLQAKLAQAQLENLRLQLQPHFLFNTLNAISSVMYEDVRKADEMIAKLSDFLRSVLASGSVQCVPLGEELSLERAYVDIMTTRLEQRLALNIDVAEEAREAQVPFMLLQPLIENSIRHGMTGERSGLGIDVMIRRDNGSTVIEVLDDGIGFLPQRGRGHGLNNVESRLAYLYGDASAFSIAPRDGGGTAVTLRFPYERAGAPA